MSESTTTLARKRRSARQTLNDVANPATIKGSIAIVVGLVLIVVPELSVTVVEYAAGIGLLTVGLFDLWHALTGRGDYQAGSRWLALGRGAASIGVGLLILVARQDTIAVIVAILGIYLLARGLLTFVAAIFTRKKARRTAGFTIGITGTAVGVVLLTVPRSLTEGLLIAGAAVALVVGAILLAYGVRVGAPDSPAVDVSSSSTSEILWAWVRSNDVGLQRREELAGTLYFENPGRASKLVAWWVMLMLAVAIATYAVLQDSTAVVIGAMLIAPLMTPILGLAGAVVNGWQGRSGASSALVALGVMASVALAYIISSWVPALVSFEANTQVISRTDPTFVDMLIALSAGAAGAFATVNTRVGSSIAGVAIAVALVPPLSVVGVSLEQQRWDEASGALLLFMTNFVSIVLAAAAVFVLTGFADGARLRRNQRQVLSTLAPFGTLAMVILIPLVFTTEGILASSTQQKTAQGVIDEWAGEDNGLRVGKVTVRNNVVTVDIAGTEAIPPPRRLQQDLSEALGDPVQVVIEYTPSAQIIVSESGRVQRDEASTDAE